MQSLCQSVRHLSDSLIAFGDAIDIKLYENCNKTTNNYSRFGDPDSTYSRADELRPEGVSRFDNTYMAGSLNFKVKELEVYHVLFE